MYFNDIGAIGGCLRLKNNICGAVLIEGLKLSNEKFISEGGEFEIINELM